MTRYRCHFNDGTEAEVDAASADQAEALTRRFAHVGARSTTIHDRGPAWSIVNLAEYPDPQEPT